MPIGVTQFPCQYPPFLIAVALIAIFRCMFPVLHALLICSQSPNCKNPVSVSGNIVSLLDMHWGNDGTPTSFFLHGLCQSSVSAWRFYRLHIGKRVSCRQNPGLVVFGNRSSATKSSHPRQYPPVHFGCVSVTTISHSKTSCGRDSERSAR